jgi:glucosylceramidase
MIHDFNNGAVAWTDWNILLDETGGPNHVGNFSFSPVHAQTKEGTIYYLNSYYYIGHFSKFIRPGARRITCSSTMVNLLTTAFINPDGKIAVVVMNTGGEKLPYRMFVGKKGVQLSSLPHSIETLSF